MYNRNRPSQGYGNVRNQSTPPTTSGSFQNPNSYSQGNYQSSQPSGNQQGAYKQGNGQNTQMYKLQQQQQQGHMPAGIAARSVQQSKVLPSPQQQQQQQHQLQHPFQQQQQQQTSPSSPSMQPRLKPILKQSIPITSAVAPAPENSPVKSPQSSPSTPPSVPISVPTVPPTSTPVPNSNLTTMVTEPADLNTESNIKIEAALMDMDSQEQPRWRRKVPGFKVNKRLKRIRMNQRLRKTLQPKNAIMVLNELKAGVQFTFPETQGPMPSSLYVVHAELDGKTYVGQGLSKPLARQNAAENALQALLLEKMTAASMKAQIDAETDGQNSQPSDGKAQNSEDGSAPMDVDENDEIPWSSLASFALYKLFLEWHNQGTSVPVPRPGLPPQGKGGKKESSQANKAPVQKELPPNATNIHPVMLLNQMRPGLTYVEVQRVGNPPNTMFTLAVEIDGVQYTGTAKNKKDAKRIAAKAALLALYNLTYPDEKKIDGQGNEIQVN